MCEGGLTALLAFGAVVRCLRPEDPPAFSRVIDERVQHPLREDGRGGTMELT